MAETLGSLVDKLTIKQIRQFHLNEMLENKDKKFPPEQLKEKLKILEKQKQLLTEEIDAFVIAATKGKTTLRDEKLKLYNAVKDIGRIPATDKLGQAIEGLAQKNLELWHLEDQARRKDVDLAYIGGIKQKIDLVNQQRNDYMDKIDQLFEEIIKRNRRG